MITGATPAEVIDTYLEEPAISISAELTPLPRPRLSELLETRPRDLLAREYQELTALDLLLSGAVAVDVDELGHIGHLSAALIPARDLHARLELPDGREVASLHSHLSKWRHQGLDGFTTVDVPLSSRLRPP